MPTYRIHRFVPLLVACAVLTACGKNEAPTDNDTATAPTLDQATSPAKARHDLQQTQSAKAERGNPATPLDQYKRLNSGRQIMWAYLAISPNPRDDDKIAESVSRDYAMERDEFKKRDLLAALKPQIDGEVEKAQANKYYVFTTHPRLRSYDFDGKHFPVESLSEDGEHYFNDGNAYRLKFSNAGDFTHLSIRDESQARQIEAARTGSENYKMKLAVYFFAGDTVLGRPVINAQIMKIRLLDKDGQLLAEQ